MHRGFNVEVPIDSIIPLFAI